MKKLLTGVVVAGMLAVSGGVSAKPLTISFDGYSSAVENDNNRKIRSGEKLFFTVSIDFEKCIMTEGEMVIEGTECLPDSFVSVSSEMLGPVPVVSQTWVYAKPDGSYIYTYQMAHGWQTTVFRGNSYKVIR